MPPLWCLLVTYHLSLITCHLSIVTCNIEVGELHVGGKLDVCTNSAPALLCLGSK